MTTYQNRPDVGQLRIATCRCDRCTSREARRSSSRFARLTLFALMLGLGAAWILDQAIDGPGLGNMFGL